MEHRILGKTGLSASVFAFGGIVVMDTPQQEANDIVKEAYEAGINYYDVAPSYGNAQDILGPALKPFRKDVLLACKSGKRDRDGLFYELHESMKLLHTDYFDVYQLHALTSPEEIDQALAPGGALEALLDAKKEGLVRHIGFSSHSDEGALRLLKTGVFESMLFPVNWALWLNQGMGRAPLAEAARQDLARPAIKALAFGPKQPEDDGYGKCWYRPIIDDVDLADLALRFTLMQDVSLAVSPGDVRMLRLGLDIVNRYSGNPPPLSDAEMAVLQGRAAEVEGSIF